MPHSQTAYVRERDYVLCSFPDTTVIRVWILISEDRFANIDFRISIFEYRFSNIDFRISLFEYRFSNIAFRISIFEYRLPKTVWQKSISEYRFLKIGLCTVGPSIFHMSAQQKKAARGACFRIPYYQSDQIIQKTCRCILRSFTCLAHWKKKIENWSATTIFHIPCFQDAFHSSM